MRELNLFEASHGARSMWFLVNLVRGERSLVVGEEGIGVCFENIKLLFYFPNFCPRSKQNIIWEVHVLFVDVLIGIKVRVTIV